MKTARNFVTKPFGEEYFSTHAQQDWLPVFMVIYKYYFVPSYYQITSTDGISPIQALETALIAPQNVHASLKDSFIAGLNEHPTLAHSFEPVAKRIIELKNQRVIDSGLFQSVISEDFKFKQLLEDACCAINTYQKQSAQPKQYSGLKFTDD